MLLFLSIITYLAEKYLDSFLVVTRVSQHCRNLCASRLIAFISLPLTSSSIFLLPFGLSSILTVEQTLSLILLPPKNNNSGRNMLFTALIMFHCSCDNFIYLIFCSLSALFGLQAFQRKRLSDPLPFHSTEDKGTIILICLKILPATKP